MLGGCIVEGCPWLGLLLVLLLLSQQKQIDFKVIHEYAWFTRTHPIWKGMMMMVSQKGHEHDCGGSKSLH